MNPLVLGGVVFNGLVMFGRLMGWLKPHEATNGLLGGLTAMGLGLAVDLIDKEEERVFRHFGLPIPGSRKTSGQKMVVLDEATTERLQHALRERE